MFTISQVLVLVPVILLLFNILILIVMLIYEYFVRMTNGEKMSLIDMFEFMLDLVIEIYLWSMIAFVAITAINVYL